MKFASEDRRYIDQRKEYSTNAGKREIWTTVDHWPLYVGISNLARYMAIGDLLRSTYGVPGHVAEFGSWRGSNLMFMAKMLKIHDHMGSKVVHCFDSFEGLTTFVKEDGEADSSQGAYAGSYEELEAMIELYQLQDNIEIHKGLIQETLLPLLDKNPALTFSFVYCDTDLFEPTKIILESLHTRLAKGGVFVFDEWNDARWPGEGIAANEFMKRFGDYYEMVHVPNTRQPSMAIRKIRY